MGLTPYFAEFKLLLLACFSNMANVGKRRGSSMFVVSSLSDDFVHTERIRIYQALPTRNTKPHSRNVTARPRHSGLCQVEGNVGLMGYSPCYLQRCGRATVHWLRSGSRQVG
jgi:hypothetical protein